MYIFFIFSFRREINKKKNTLTTQKNFLIKYEQNLLNFETIFTVFSNKNTVIFQNEKNQLNLELNFQINSKKNKYIN